MLNPNETALVLIGYQNDYFSDEGVLHSVIEQSSQEVLDNTVSLIEAIKDSGVFIIDLPISFTENYSELAENASGILEIIRDKGAFQVGKPGSDVIPEIERFREGTTQVLGKRGLDGFCNTKLDELLKERNIKNIILAGAVISICIDSTARSAKEKGYNVTVLSSCTSARSEFEHSFYCTDIFPLYADVTDHQSLIEAFRKDAA